MYRIKLSAHSSRLTGQCSRHIKNEQALWALEKSRGVVAQETAYAANLKVNKLKPGHGENAHSGERELYGMRSDPNA